MCGVFAYICPANNGFNSKEADFVSMMIYLTTLRGEDSTGVFSVDYNGNVDIVKDAVDGPTFLKTKEYKSFRGDLIRKGKFVVGHGRAATRGSVSDKNAHPFVVDDKIVLVQNGTYKGSHRHLKDTDVDTEAVAHVFAEHLDDIPAAFKRINAAFALMWYNVPNETLHIIRNSERPLVYARFKGGGVAVASEAAFIELAAKRCGMELQEKDPYTMKDDHLMSVKLVDRKAVFSFEDIDTKYDYTKGPASASSGTYPFRNLALGYDCDTDDCVVPIRQHHPRHYPTYNRADDYGRVDRMVRDCLDDMGAFVYEKGSNPPREYNTGSKVTFEVMDYYAVNDNPLCNKWYFIGREVAPDTEDNSNWPLIYFVVSEATENEALHRAFQGIYRGEIDFCLNHEVWSKGVHLGFRRIYKVKDTAQCMSNFIIESTEVH